MTVTKEYHLAALKRVYTANDEVESLYKELIATHIAGNTCLAKMNQSLIHIVFSMGVCVVGLFAYILFR